jgi:GNAT superfamily N-acetyltransferase
VTIAFEHRVATAADIAKLAQMNQQLIEDEGHRNPMNLIELETRMRSPLAGGYTATLFEWNSRAVAYGLWRDQPEWVYLRQCFVARDFRRRGIGARAMRMLTNELLPADKRIRVNVLVGNRPALEFWRAVGLADNLVTLKMERSG